MEQGQGVALLVLGLLGGALAQQQVAADQGNWTVGDCIMVKVASQIVLQPDPDNTNLTITMELPVTALPSGYCKNPQTNKTDDNTQQISLNWADTDKKTGVQLNRSITIDFLMNVTSLKYGVSKISAMYQWRQYVVNTTVVDPVTNASISENVTVTAYVSMTTFKMDPLEFLVPVNRSYLCLDAGSKPMHTELHKSNEPIGDGGVKLPDAVLSAKKVQLDAFRGGEAPADEFQTSMDCTYRPNDVVPIIVGCALAGLVLMVLVAYLVGRRKSRARGYQSV